MAQNLRRSQPAVGGPHQHLQNVVARLRQNHFTPEHAAAADGDIDIFGHGFRGFGIRGNFDDRDDRMTDDVALAGGKQMKNRSGRAK